MSCMEIIPQAPDLKAKLAALPPAVRTPLETRIGTCIAAKRAAVEAKRDALEAKRAAVEAGDTGDMTFKEILSVLHSGSFTTPTCTSLSPEEACYRQHANAIDRLAAKQQQAVIPYVAKIQTPTITLGLVGALTGTLIASSRRTSIPLGGIVGGLLGALTATLTAKMR